MALTGTGKWTPGQASSSVQDRDFFSGALSVNNTAYSDSQEYQFGFSAPEVLITNTSATLLVFQWLSRKGTTIDSGVVPANQAIAFRMANKTGIRLRVESGTATGYVTALG